MYPPHAPHTVELGDPIVTAVLKEISSDLISYHGPFVKIHLKTESWRHMAPWRQLKKMAPMIFYQPIAICKDRLRSLFRAWVPAGHRSGIGQMMKDVSRVFMVCSFAIFQARNDLFSMSCRATY
jgi:hypothetical protein